MMKNEMLSPLSAARFRKEILAWKSAFEIRSLISDLRKEIEDLKEYAENPLKHKDQDLAPHCSNTAYAAINRYRKYISEAKKVLSDLGEEYLPTEEEIRSDEFQANIDHIQKIIFCLDSFGSYPENYSVEIDGDKLSISSDYVLHDMGLTRREFSSPESFRNFIRGLHMGEWITIYDTVRFGIRVLDGVSWNIEILYDNDIPPVHICGSNSYPYNFNRFANVMTNGWYSV